MSAFVLKEGAFIISDAHYAPYRDELNRFLQTLEEQNFLPPQILLFGDIFDFLSADSSYSKEFSKPLVKRLNRLSKSIKILYLEGNHDFNLESIFEDIEVISASKQPYPLYFGNKTIYCSHGDRGLKILHEIYMKTLTSPYIVKILDFFDKNILDDKIAKSIYKHLFSKKICNEMANFEEIALKRAALYTVFGEEDDILEGHFHQDKIFEIGKKRYFSVPSFACNQSFFVVESEQSDIFLSSRRASAYYQ